MSAEHEIRRATPASVTLAALGVVFGDIGTSPLYTLKECFYGPHAIAVSPANVMGILSLIFWSLMVVITIKYVLFVSRADDHGEGGTFALLALLQGAVKRSPANPFFRALPYLALCSAAFLYSDGMITPAISVLSAVEGLHMVLPAAGGMVVPLTCGILILLFMLQKYGAARIGGIFCPVMLLWFAALACCGLINIAACPQVLAAVNPWHAIAYFQASHLHGLLVLGTVVLCITGGEALYADLGHFGRRPIRKGWLFLACPALVLNYMGQGAVLLGAPASGHNPFYQAVPQFFLPFMMVLATLATVIASQALISGVYSLTQQAVLLGFLPRMRVVHTSTSARGQIYLPTINNLLMAACIALVLIFQNSSGLAAAYGLAVTGAMGITSLLFFAVTRFIWQWPLWKAGGLLLLFLCFDLPFLGANLIKILDGGWLPLLGSVVLISVMTTWKKGRALMQKRFEQMSMPLPAFLSALREEKQSRSPGIGVFMTLNQHLTPMPLARSMALIHSVPERIVLLTVKTEERPYVEAKKRIRLDDREKDAGLYRMLVSYGYMQNPDMAEIAECSKHSGLYLPLYDCTFYLGRESILAAEGARAMRPWRRAIFIFLSNNAWNAATFYNIPSSRVVEIGTHLSL